MLRKPYIRESISAKPKDDFFFLNSYIDPYLLSETQPYPMRPRRRQAEKATFLNNGKLKPKIAS